MNIGDKVSITGLLPFKKSHIRNKEGVVLDVEPHNVFSISVLIEGEIERFEKDDLKIK